jgi:hypothetical protein
MEYVHGFSMGKRYEEPKEYATIIRSTIEKLLRDASGRYDAEDGWQLALEKQGVTIYRKKSIKIKGKRTVCFSASHFVVISSHSLSPD